MKPLSRVSYSFRETHFLQRGDAAADLPARQALRVAGQCEAGALLRAGPEDLQVEFGEEGAIHVAHVGLEQRMLAAVGQVRVVGVGQRCGAQLLQVEDDEVVVQHADARHPGRGQRPGGVEAGFAGQRQVLRRVGIALQHVLDDDLVHVPVPDRFLDGIRYLRAAHRPAERVEDGLRGIVDDRAIELVAVAQCLAIEQQAFGIFQQAVVVHQVGQVLGAVEELVGLHAFRHGQRNRAEGGDYFPGTGLHQGALQIGLAAKNRRPARHRQSNLVKAASSASMDRVGALPGCRRGIRAPAPALQRVASSSRSRVFSTLPVLFLGSASTTT